MYVNLADNINIDAQKIMTGRGCIIGQSGSGKSFLAGVIAEELCKLNMPFCVIDTEGEYSSLKSKFNVLIVGGQYKDIDLKIDYLKLFNLSIADGIPIIIDLSETTNKQEIVYSALSSLYNVEDKLKKPYLILIEEGDKFAPQALSKKPNIIDEISVRGRKRGIGLLVATQRPANISKNVLSQCSYGFIGKLTIENDISAIKILFNDKGALRRITQLDAGEFLSFGTGYNNVFKVKPRLIKHIGSTPTISNYKIQNNKIKDIINELKQISINDSNQNNLTKNKNQVSILAIPIFFTLDDAENYAKKLLKRKFLFFGDKIESIESINLIYLPFAECTVRLPTKNKNEFLEYFLLLNENCDFISIKNKKIKFIKINKENFNNITNIMKKTGKTKVKTEKINIEKNNIIKNSINETAVKKCFNKIETDFIFNNVEVIYMPVYKITLRSKNRLRIFFLDAIFGNEISVSEQ
ncbi:MAG: ATP-binding protein [Candidatus Micrarchaeia archaeon]